MGSFGKVCGARPALAKRARKLLNYLELRGIGFVLQDPYSAEIGLVR